MGGGCGGWVNKGIKKARAAGRPKHKRTVGGRFAISTKLGSGALRSASAGRTKGAGGGGGLAAGAFALCGRAFSFAAGEPAPPGGRAAARDAAQRLSTCAYLPCPSGCGSASAAEAASADSRAANARAPASFICRRLSAWWFRVNTGLGGFSRLPIWEPRSMSWLLRMVALIVGVFSSANGDQERNRRRARPKGGKGGADAHHL